MDDIRQRINHDYVGPDGKPFESSLYFCQYTLTLLSNCELPDVGERE